MMNPEYGTERCPHICHYIHDVLQKGSVYTHPRHCSACDGSKVMTIAEAKASGLPQRACDQDFKDWLIGGKDLLDYCVCGEYSRSCRFHNGGKTVADGPHNVLPALPYRVKFWTDNAGKPQMEVISESNGNLNKLCGLTADEIRRRYEDAMMGLLGSLPDWKLAVIYAWLHNRGMRMDDTERIIREGLRKEVASK